MKIKQQTNESPGYAACIAVAEPLNIPRVGARFIKGEGPKPMLIRMSVCCDFAGTVRGSGRMLVVDFKRNDGVGVFPILPSHVSPRQREELIRHGSVGAAAGLLIESSRHRRNFWCDWTLLHWAWDCGDSSIAWERMEDLGPSSVVADLTQIAMREFDAKGAAR